MNATDTAVAPATNPRASAATLQAAAPATPLRKRAARRSRYVLPGSGDSWRISAVTVLMLLALWWLVTGMGWIAPLFLPSPAATLDAFVAALKGQTQGELPLYEHVLVSMSRVLSAFTLAVVTGVPLGIAMGTSRALRGIADPLIEFYRPLPPLAYLPLIVIWLGIDESSKVTLIYLACLAPMTMAAKAGVRSVPIEQINAAFSMGATRWQVTRMVVLPGALPEVLTGMRIAIGFGWTTLVAAEMVAASSGLGQMVLNASNFLRTDVVIMGIVLIGLLACAFDLLIRRLERAMTPWKGRM